MHANFCRMTLGVQLVRAILDEAAAAGLTLVRAWAHGSSPEYALQPAPGRFSEPIFRGLDYALDQARQRGIKARPGSALAPVPGALLAPCGSGRSVSHIAAVLHMSLCQQRSTPRATQARQLGLGWRSQAETSACRALRGDACEHERARSRGAGGGRRDACAWLRRARGRRGCGRPCAAQVLLSLVNNWGVTGGVDEFVAWSPTAAVHQHFFTDPACRAMYRATAAAVIGRVNTVNGRRRERRACARPLREPPVNKAGPASTAPQLAARAAGTATTPQSSVRAQPSPPGALLHAACMLGGLAWPRHDGTQHCAGMKASSPDE